MWRCRHLTSGGGGVCGGGALRAESSTPARRPCRSHSLALRACCLIFLRLSQACLFLCISACGRALSKNNLPPMGFGDVWRSRVDPAARQWITYFLWPLLLFLPLDFSLPAGADLVAPAALDEELFCRDRQQMNGHRKKSPKMEFHIKAPAAVDATSLISSACFRCFWAIV